MSIDWRIQAAATVAHDVPAAYPGGPSHRVGSKLVLTSIVQTPDGPTAFLAPSAVAIALSIAAKNSQQADLMRASFVTAAIPSPDGTIQLLSSKAAHELFDYFERCFAATIFAFQAIEAYCNFKIAYTLQGQMRVRRRKSEELMGCEQIERLPTDEKLDLVLPKLLKRASPKGTVTWEKFRELESVRDATVHLKSHHQWGSSQSFDDSPYAVYLRESPTTLVVRAVDVIRYFSGPHEMEWLDGTSAILSGQNPNAKP